MRNDWLSVFKVVFRKNKGRYGKPDSLLVEYYCDEFGETVKEWVCIEHQGYAGNKASQWWSNVVSSVAMPKRVDGAIEILQTNDAVVMPTLIKIKDANGYPSVCDYRFNGKQPEIDGKRISRAEYKENIIQNRFD